MSNLLDLYTEDSVKHMLKIWYGKEMPVNENVILIVYSIIQSSIECTSPIDKIPCTLGGVTGLSSGLTSIVKTTIKRIIQYASNDKDYIMHLKAEALARRSEIELASMG